MENCEEYMLEPIEQKPEIELPDEDYLYEQHKDDIREDVMRGDVL